MTKEERNARRRELRLEKIANGMCPTCKNKLDEEGYSQCSDCRKKAFVYRDRCKEKHREEYNAKQRERNAYRRENGLCAACGVKISNGKSRCDDCAEKESKARKEIRTFRRENGYCPRCGKNKLFGDEKNCIECNTKSAIYQYGKGWRGKGSRAEYQRRKRQEKRENNLCTNCGKPTDDSRYVMCSLCRSKTREKSKLIRINDGMLSVEEKKARTEKGFCYVCGKTVKEGINAKSTKYKLCPDCFNRSNKNLENANKDTSNHVWRNQNKLIFGRRSD